MFLCLMIIFNAAVMVEAGKEDKDETGRAEAIGLIFAEAATGVARQPGAAKQISEIASLGVAFIDGTLNPEDFVNLDNLMGPGGEN